MDFDQYVYCSQLTANTYCNKFNKLRQIKWILLFSSEAFYFGFSFSPSVVTLILVPSVYILNRLSISKSRNNLIYCLRQTDDLCNGLARYNIHIVYLPHERLLIFTLFSLHHFTGFYCNHLENFHIVQYTYLIFFHTTYRDPLITYVTFSMIYIKIFI